MRPNLLAQHVEAIPCRTTLDHQETVRVAGAATALIAAALVLLAGLLWREHARAEHRPSRASVVTIR
jgi:hypothetical protein